MQKKNGEITTMSIAQDNYMNSTRYRKFRKQKRKRKTCYSILILILFFVNLLFVHTEASSLTPVKEQTNNFKSNVISFSFNEYLNKPNIQIAHKIMPGDTLFSIARKHYESTESIAKLQLDNNIKNPSLDFKAGNIINISNPKVIDIYKVKTGDTLFSITQKYFNRGWYIDYVQSVNGIKDPSIDIKVGMKITLPLTKSTAIHTFRPGETLYGIVLKYFHPSNFQELIIEHNEIANPANLKAGLAIKIPNPFYTDKSVLKGTISKQKPSYYIEINKSKNSLAIFNNQILVRTLPVATGKSKSLTPEGTFKIVNKIKDPWYSPKGIPGGTSKNPLGSRWLGLDVPNTNGTKYGIHGTNNPTSIGKYASLGCIRMNNKDVQWVYDHIPTGTVVVIKNK
jgi:lipoprotein-anchoring transpeptidase ErfK/SrfK